VYSCSHDDAEQGLFCRAPIQFIKLMADLHQIHAFCVCTLTEW
jgi:hypothetical protein